jgi:hypothetical protein
VQSSLLLRLGSGLLISFFLAGCDFSQFPQSASDWIALFKEKPTVSVSPRPSETPAPGSTAPMSDQEYASAAARNAKANAEILHEMLQVIFMKEPRDRGEFGNWADTLNQGASLEGVYNGLTHSGEYRKLESIHTGASPEAVRVFAEELALLELELPIPTEFDSSSASPLPVLGIPDSVQRGSDSSVGRDRPSLDRVTASPSPGPEPKVLAAKYLSQFIGASIFTLKRVLSDEALKVIAAKLEYREKLALWYSKWVVRLAQRNVDFGISLRNKPDEAFHFKWALESTDDRVKWEVLNRIHRLLNEANRLKQ